MHLRPRADVEAAYAEKVRFRARRQEQYRSCASCRPRTQDGVEIGLHMNAGLLVDLPHLEETGARGIGLFRTELQFMIAERIPAGGEQQKLYREVLDAAGDKPVTFRTLDIGGDKVLPYMQTAKERRTRRSAGGRSGSALDRPGLLRTQIRALLKAAAGRELRVMFPMVATLRRVRPGARPSSGASRPISPAMASQPPASVKLGAMIEVPSLLFQLDEHRRAVDFVSVGSNDLIQFVIAADRGNRRVATASTRCQPGLAAGLEAHRRSRRPRPSAR